MAINMLRLVGWMASAIEISVSHAQGPRAVYLTITSAIVSTDALDKMLRAIWFKWLNSTCRRSLLPVPMRSGILGRSDDHHPLRPVPLSQDYSNGSLGMGNRRSLHPVPFRSVITRTVGWPPSPSSCTRGVRITRMAADVLVYQPIPSSCTY
jgi:hypothetical protein